MAFVTLGSAGLIGTTVFEDGVRSALDVVRGINPGLQPITVLRERLNMPSALKSCCFCW